MIKFGGTVISAILMFVFLLFTQISASYSSDVCGLATRKSQAPEYGNELHRFEILAEHGGRAFIDMRTCLVWDLYMWKKPSLTIDKAMEICATNGQGGPYGEMGWQIPTMAELTSLDSMFWGTHPSDYTKYDMPPVTRDDTVFWTSTPWLGATGANALVMFDVRTTLVLPSNPDTKAGVWCVQGYRANGLR